MTIEQSSLSLEYVKADVTCDSSPLGYTVSFAFKTDGANPGGGDWKTGSWDTSITTSPYRARILVGPTGEVLSAGLYQVWTKIAGTPEVPVRCVGQLRIT